MISRRNLKADQPGTFQGLSAQFSGDGFSDMRFDLVSVGTAEFKEWVTTSKRQGGLLDAAAFTDLAQPAKAENPQTYAEVTEGLFDTISSSHMAANPLRRGN
jgi:cytochrome o ubiquinol oxidase subunit II